MPKYSINTKGEVFLEKEENGQTTFENITNNVSLQINRDIKNTKKPSEEFDLLITKKYLGLDQGDFNNFINPNSSRIEEYIVKKSNNNINKSFNFLKKEGNLIVQKANDEFENVDIYTSYNSIFDLDSSDNFIGRQIFADDVDFYGVPLFLKDPLDAGQESLIKLLTLFDMILAATFPVVTISILQTLIQASQENSNSLDPKNGDDNKDKRKYEKNELGKYISYSRGNEILNSFFIILERTLNAFERLMNYPKFKSDISIGNMFNDVGYFILGYTMYLNPGAKIDFLKKEDDELGSLNSSQILSDILSTLITSDSFSHPFNLLIRKIARNNYFYKKVSETPSKLTTSGEEEIGSFSRNISYLGNYFYRFIGERISVGEKVYKIEKEQKSIKSLENDKFHVTRINDLSDLTALNNKINAPDAREAVQNFDPFRDKTKSTNVDVNVYKKNTSITSFRHSLDEPESIETNNDNTKKYKKNAWQLMTENTQKRLFPTGEFELSRMSKGDVFEIEERINKEYMPFSFHDLRTNEVFRFHAFIDSLTDGFSPNYSDSTGFGRMDPVKIYTGTTRSIGLSFFLISTSKEDHDEMWYYINRLVAMIYPQWSKPETAHPANYKEIKAKNGDYLPFGKPFTQMPIASPVIRIRVGDLIKSNYDRDVVLKNIFNLNGNMYNKSQESKIEYKSKFIDYLNGSPIIQSYEKVKGEGIAGVIRSLNVVTDQNATWEIEEGSRAPITVKIDLQFEPIHDISLGLNHMGELRALPYNVGEKSKKEAFEEYLD